MMTWTCGDRVTDTDTDTHRESGVNLHRSRLHCSLASPSTSPVASSTQAWRTAASGTREIHGGNRDPWLDRDQELDQACLEQLVQISKACLQETGSQPRTHRHRQRVVSAFATMSFHAHTPSCSRVTGAHGNLCILQI